MGSLGKTGPHSLCISLLYPPVGIRQQVRMADSPLLSHQLEHGAEEPSEGLGPLFFLKICFPGSFGSGGGRHEQYVIVLWISCKPASEGGFRSQIPFGLQGPVSNASHPSYLALFSTHAVHALSGEGKAKSGGPWGNQEPSWQAVSLPSYLPVITEVPPATAWATLHQVKGVPLELCSSPARSLVRQSDRGLPLFLLFSLASHCQ